MINSSVGKRCAGVGVLVVLLAGRAAAAGHVLVVDPVAGPGVDFTTVPAAIAAALENDTLLVHAGTYAAAAVVAGKSLAIVGRPGDDVTINASFSVTNLAADQFVSIAGIAFTKGLQLTNDVGAVWVENCIIGGQNVFTIPFPFPADATGGTGLAVSGCSNVTIVRTPITGGSATAPGASAFGGDAIVSSQSSVWLFDVACVGGSAWGCPDICANIPGDGARVTGGKTFLEGSSIHGYRGIVLVSGSPSLWQLDSDVASSELDFLGNPFPPIVGPGTVTQLAGSERDFTIETPVHEQDTLPMSLDGEVGDTAWLFLAVDPVGVMTAKFHGPLLVGTGNTLLLLGQVPAGGTLSSMAAVPTLPPGIESAAVVLQAAFVGTGGAIYLSDPSRLVMLGAQF